MERWVEYEGELGVGLMELYIIRKEYDLVRLIEKIIRRDNQRIKLFDIRCSMIASLEKNPERKGIPIRARLVVPRAVKVRGEDE